MPGRGGALSHPRPGAGGCASSRSSGFATPASKLCFECSLRCSGRPCGLRRGRRQGSALVSWSCAGRLTREAELPRSGREAGASRPGARTWGSAIPPATWCRGVSLVAKLWLRDAGVEALLRVQSVLLEEATLSASLRALWERHPCRDRVGRPKKLWARPSNARRAIRDWQQPAPLHPSRAGAGSARPGGARGGCLARRCARRPVPRCGPCRPGPPRGG